MIITGAPVELMPFEDVDYWHELCEIMEWTKTNVHSTFHVCWGAQAGLYYHYGIQKYTLPKKVCGIYRHKILTPKSRLFRGFDEAFYVPHSRYTETKAEDILKNPALRLMSVSERSGVHIVGDLEGRQFFVTGHSEYDADTLKKEYERDLKKGIAPEIPYNYFPDDNPALKPRNIWRAHATLLYTNWLNYFVYQTTPYDISDKITE